MLRPLWAGCTRLAAEIEPLWIGGLALALLALGDRCLPLTGEDYEWAQYLLLGTVYPALLLALSLLARTGPTAARLLYVGNVGLAVFALAAAYPILRHRFDYPFILMALIQWGLIAWLRRRAPAAPGDAAPWHHGLLGQGVVLAVSWAACTRFMYWDRFGTWIIHHAFAVVVLILSGLLVAWNCCRPADGEGRPGRLANLAGLLLLVLLSVRVGPLGRPELHHWGVLVGPAQMVQQGGWLLWDVPCQYGFLSTLTLALLPTATTWQALYVVNASICFLSAAFLFLVLRLRGQGAANFVFALAVAAAAVLIVPGIAGDRCGPQHYPSVGPFRFIWCYAILAVLFWEAHVDLTAGPHRHILWLGCLAWLAGVLWSSESGTYCTAAWLPAYGVLLWRRARQRAGPVGWRVWGVLGWLCLPPILLSTAAAVIGIYYHAALGHGPDWGAFLEYALAFRDGFCALPIDPDGLVWMLLIALAAFAALCVAALRRDVSPGLLGLAVGAWGAYWASASYFVSRCHENNATNLSCTLGLAAALTLWAVGKLPVAAAFRRCIPCALVPVLTAMLTLAFGSDLADRAMFHAVRRGYRSDVTRQLPVPQPTLRRLLGDAVRADDPVVYLDRHGALSDLVRPERGASHPAWVPVYPVALLTPLPEERRRLYLARFVARCPRAGWLVQPDRGDEPALAWLFDELRRTHVPVRSVQDGGWRLTWYELRTGALARRP
jgi:hypothetical protein